MLCSSATKRLLKGNVSTSEVVEASNLNNRLARCTFEAFPILTDCIGKLYKPGQYFQLV